MTYYSRDPIVNTILTRIVTRADAGMTTYGQSMHDAQKPLASWIDDAIEELLDAALYLEKLKTTIDGYYSYNPAEDE
jgi:hypothetical protein